MNAKASSHPTDQTLRAFSLGELDAPACEAVSEHLEQCPDCRQRVAAGKGGSFNGRARDNQALRAVPVSERCGSAPSHALELPPDLAHLPDYEIVRELGRGGMGVVYLARNQLMGREEVLKVVSKHVVDRKGVLDRFIREIRSAAKLQHPNVVTVYTAFRSGESILFAMEYVNGLDLAKMVKTKGPLPVPHACYFLHQVALGLQHAHEEGLVHRDIKPANLMVSRSGKKATVKILDFGLAKATREEPVDGGLTREGQMLGTPDCIAPEQIRDARSADIRADIYSLGCTLYYLLTGGPPFRVEKLWDLYQAHFSINADPLNVARPEVPAELAALVAKMMAKEPARRFQTPAEVAQALLPFSKADAPKPAALRRRESNVTGPDATMSPAVSGPAANAVAPAASETRWESLINTSDPEDDEDTTTPHALAGSPECSRLGQRRGWTSMAAGLVFLAIAAAAAFALRTRNGTIVLENLPRNAEVTIDDGIAPVEWPKGTGKDRAEITSRSGKHSVAVKVNGTTVARDDVLVEPAGETRFVVGISSESLSAKKPARTPVPAREKPTPSLPDPARTSPGLIPSAEFDSAGTPSAARKDQGWIALFNGKDTAGWKVVPSAPGNWRVASGVLIGAGPPIGYLFSERGDYKDFRLQVEARINRGGNSGILFPLRFGGRWDEQYEVNLIDDSSNGALGVRGSLPRFATSSVPAGEWFTLEVLSEGKHVVTKIGGKTVADFVDATPPACKGYIALELCDPHTVVEFRKIDIQELNAGTSNARLAESGVVSPSPAGAIPFSNGTAVATSSATVRTAGPREGAAGMRFFDVVGKNAPDRASFGVLEFTVPKVEAQIADDLKLSLTRLIPAFSREGRVRVYLSNDSKAPRGALRFRGENGVDDQLKPLILLATHTFRRGEAGTPDDIHLPLDSNALAAFWRLAEDGGIIRLVLVPADSDVAATYFGVGDENPEQRPKLVLRNTGGRVPTKPPAKDSAWVSLFNHKDLSGWANPAANGSQWRVTPDGILEGKGGGRGNSACLTFERRDFANFALRVTMRLVLGIGSRIAIRQNGDADHHRAYLIQASGSTRYPIGRIGTQFGDLVNMGAEVEETPFPEDQWRTIEIVANGNSIATSLVGGPALDFHVDPDSTAKAGAIAVQCGGLAVVQIRDILIKEITTARIRKGPSAVNPPSAARTRNVSTPPSLPLVSTPGLNVMRDGAFGFPQAEATVLCDQPALRVAAWNDSQILYVQAIMRLDDDGPVGRAQNVVDWAQLLLDADANGKTTANFDRRYALYRDGLRYVICIDDHATTVERGDSKGRGAMRTLRDENGVPRRVDSFAIPLSELRRESGQEIRFAYFGESPRLPVPVNSVGFRSETPYNSYALPVESYKAFVLAKRAAVFDITIPDYR